MDNPGPGRGLKDVDAKNDDVGKELDNHANPWLCLAKERLASVGISGGPSQVSDDAVRDLIEQEVQGALLAISSLRYRQNRLAPINNLPPELLSRIFHELSFEPLEPYSLPMSWLAVTYVCRTWRSTAMECASLWIVIPLCLGQRWAQAFVSRSKGASLSVAAYSTQISKPSWKFDLISGQFSRLAIVALSGRINVETFRELVVSFSPDQLHKLTLDAQIQSPYEQTRDPIHLLKAQRLRDVSLKQIPVAWSTLPWAGLRVVEIIGPPPNSATADLSSLLTALQSTTILEKLHLGLKSIKFVTSGGVGSSIVQLPRLRTFQFAGYAADFQALLHIVQIPKTASVVIDMLEDKRSTASISIVSDLLRAQSGYAVAKPHIRLRSMSIVADNSGSIRLRAWPSCEGSLHSTTSPAFIDITLCSHRGITSDLAVICQDINVTLLNRVHVDLACYSSAWKRATWHKLFASAKKVQVLDFTGDCAHHLLKAIATPVITPALVPVATSSALAKGANASPLKRAKPSRNAMMFPSLQQLLLAGCVCDAADHDMSKLPAFVKRRVRSAPFKKLSIVNCTIQEDTIEELHEIKGVEVDWDGATGETEDEEEEECDFCDGEGCEECMEDYHLYDSDDFY